MVLDISSFGSVAGYTFNERIDGVNPGVQNNSFGYFFDSFGG
jgi:hypothetical protein